MTNLKQPTPDSSDLDEIFDRLFANKHLHESTFTRIEVAKSQILANYRSIPNIKAAVGPQLSTERLTSQRLIDARNSQNQLRTQILSALNIGGNNNG